MPKDISHSLTGLSKLHLFSVEGIDGSVKLLEELSQEEKAEVGGPAAELFTYHLINKLVAVGAEVAVCSSKEQVATIRKQLSMIQVENQDHFSANLRQQVSIFHRYLEWGQQPLFDNYPLSGLAGLALAYRNYLGKDLLSKQISFADFEFTSSEYLELKEQVATTQRLYHKIGRITPAFQSLNAGIFRHQTLTDSHEFISRLFTTFSERAEKLHRSFLEITNQFYQQRRAEYQSTFRLLSSALQQLEDARELVQATIGNTALESIPTRLAAGVSKRQKEQRELILGLHALLEDLKKHHFSTSPFSFEWPTNTSELPQSQWPGLLARYQDSLDEWFEDHRKLIREECLGLSPQTQEVPQLLTQQLIHLERELLKLIEEINDRGVFQRPFTAQAITTARQQKLLEQLLEQLAELNQLLPSYPAFYRWQHNWFSLPARLRRVIAPLLLLPNENWNTLFSSWYFEQGLHQQAKSVPVHFTPEELVQLAGSVISERALAARKKKGTSKKGRLDFISAPTDDQAKAYDLIVLVNENSFGSQFKGPRLKLRPFSHEHSSTHYLSNYGAVNPALSFFQDWHARSLPKWKSGYHTSSWPDVKTAVEELANTNGCPIINEWDTLESAYRKRGRKGILIGLQKESLPQVTPLDAVQETTYDAALIIYTPNQLTLDQLPTATNWWSLLLNTPAIEALHSLNSDQITQALLTDGANSAYGFAAFLRASESIEDQDSASFQAIARESRTRLGWTSPLPSPLLKELEPELAKRFPDYFLSLHQPWRTVYLPILLTSSSGKRHLILPDGVLPGKRDPLIEIQLHRELVAAGFELYYLSSLELAIDLTGTLDKLELKG